MVFSSLVFLFYFLPVALALYYAAHWLGFFKTRHVILTLVSYVFYGWANPLFIVLMFWSTLVDYVCGLVLTGQFRREAWGKPVPVLEAGGTRTRAQKIALVVTMCSNLLLLGFFKYYNFGMDSWNALMQSMGLEAVVYENFLRIALPLGLSFYTFHAMSYGIDVYRGEARAIRSFIDFFCFVAMYPQLVAGPIIRFQEVADQIVERSHTIQKFARGVAFLSFGLAKKILLADPCGRVADQCFGATALNATDAWYGAIGYAFQIYFDFSAYSDMAVGLGLMMGFMFAKNFDSPYLSESITEFWRRWHLSLSTWLRDYLYLPLGGNRKGDRRTYVNLMTVMLLGGLWHGAAWNFVIWGGIHGTMLVMERLRGKHSFYTRLPRFLRIGVTFVVVVFAWVFFRAADLPSALRYCSAMLGMQNDAATAGLVGGQIYTWYHAATLVLAGVVVWCGVQTWDYTRRISWPKVALIVALLGLGIVMLAATSFHPFIYFIF